MSPDILKSELHIKVDVVWELLLLETAACFGRERKCEVSVDIGFHV